MGLPKAEREFKFHPTRKWRADLAWPKAGLIVEVDGGVWSGGRHTRPGGYIKDCEKLNAATLLGWRIMRFTTDDLGAGTATPMIVEYFKRRRLIK
jgi:very-short-patch-repair endonuclease